MILSLAGGMVMFTIAESAKLERVAAQHEMLMEKFREMAEAQRMEAGIRQQADAQLREAIDKTTKVCR